MPEGATRKDAEARVGATRCQSCGGPSSKVSDGVAKCSRCRAAGASSLAEEACLIDVSPDKKRP